MNTIVFHFLFFFYITSDGAQYVAIRREIGRNLGVFAPHFCYRALLWNPHSSASSSSKATSCGKVSKISVCRRRKKCVGKKKKKKHAQNIRSIFHRTGDLIIMSQNLTREPVLLVLRYQKVPWSWTHTTRTVKGWYRGAALIPLDRPTLILTADRFLLFLTLLSMVEWHQNL